MDIPSEHDLDLQIEKADNRYKKAIRTILLTMGVCMLLLIGAVIWLSVVVAGETTQNARQVAANQAASDQRWCATLDLLASEKVPAPANPAANPSREISYQLYLDFLALRQGFGCDRRLGARTAEKADQVGQRDNADHHDEYPGLLVCHGHMIPVDNLPD